MTEFHRSYRTRWSDCDANGHLANTAYSEYGTETRIAYLSSLGWTFADFEASHFGPVLLREEIDYLRELRMGDEFTVDITNLGLSKDESRFKLKHDLFTSTGKPAARIVLLGGWMNLDRRRLASPPRRLAEILRALPRDEAFVTLPRRAKGTPL